MGRMKSCAYCGRIHASTVDCGKKPKREKESTETTKLRTCRRWDKARKEANERDHHLCRICLKQKILTTNQLETHHIIPLSAATEKAYDIDNLITLCVKHHKAADRGEINKEMLTRLAASDVMANDLLI